MPEIITVEEALFELIELLESTPPASKPPFVDVVMALSWAYTGAAGELDLTPLLGLNGEED